MNSHFSLRLLSLGSILEGHKLFVSEVRGHFCHLDILRVVQVSLTFDRLFFFPEQLQVIIELRLGFRKLFLESINVRL